MFKGLESHSTLYVLHHYTPLASLDPGEVIDILKVRPRVPLISTAVPITPPPQFSRGTTPMKWFSESDTSPLPSPLDMQKSFPSLHSVSLKPEQERDISVFRSFCAVRLVLDAIWSSVQISSGVTTSPKLEDSREGSRNSHASKSPLNTSTSSTQKVDKAGSNDFSETSRAARKLDFGSNLTPVPEVGGSGSHSVEAKSVTPPQSEGSPLTDSLQSNLYSSGVIDKLQEAKLYISLIYPLNYRLEILEDIFSLLFLTSADIKPVSVNEAKEGGSVSKTDSQVDNFSRSLSTRRSSSDIVTMFASIAVVRSRAGFLMDERIASDLLAMLQDCVFELRAAKYQQTQHQTSELTGPGEARASSSSVRSSIPITSLQQRSAKLEQYINEAKWRLQLISSKHGILAPTSFPGKTRSNMDWASSSEESDSGLSESETEEEPKKERKKHKKPGIVLTESKDQPTDKKTERRINRNDSASPTSSFSSRPPSVVHGGNVSPVFRGPSPILSASLPAPRPSVKGSFSRGSSLSSPKPKKRGEQGGAVKSKSVDSSEPSSSLVKQANQLDDDSGECADIEERSPEVHLGKKRKRLRSRNFQVSRRKRWSRLSDHSEGSVLRSSVICQMLSSPASLLRMCVKHANYLRAREVVKMFKMEGDFGGFFVDFSEQYELISQELVQKSRTSTPAKFTSSSAPGSGSTSHSQTPPRRSLESSLTPSALSQINLQMAIRTATTSSEVLESLHRLLAPSQISQMLFSGDTALEIAAEESVMLQSLTKNVPTLVMLDIVCSSKLEPLIAKRIVELALSRSQEAVNSKWDSSMQKRSSRVSQTHEITLSGPLRLLQMFSDVLGYFTNFGVVPTSPGLTTPSYSSPHSLLTTGGHQLGVDAIVNAKTFSDSYLEAREKVERELIQFSSQEHSELFTELSQSLSLDESSSFSQRYQTKLSPVSVFDELIRSLHTHTHSLISLSGSSKGSALVRQSSFVGVQNLGEVGGAVSTSYLWQFVRYITKLLELLIRCLGLGGSCEHKLHVTITEWCFFFDGIMCVM